MYDTRSVNSRVSGAASMARNMASTTRGVMPGSSRVPVIVNVLPEPVCPYVMNVTLMPPSAASTSGSAVFSNMNCCVVSPPNTASKA